jgi:hypothetical protein
MDQPDPGLFKFLTKLMLIAFIRPALVSSMPLQQLKTYSFFGANVSNAFAEAPPPKQGFYICPDKAFNEWWIQHKQRPPSHLGMSFPSSQQCKATLNHPISGKNTPMQSSVS